MNPELMSDAQVRAMLIELGHPVGPVTSSTRKPMVNKLKALLAAGARPPATSGEESDGGRLTPKARRKAMAPPKSGTKSPRRRASGRSSMEPIASSTLMEPQIRGTTRRPTSSGGYQANNYLNDSDDFFLPPPTRQPPSSAANKYTPLNAQRIGNEAFRASLNAAAINNYGSRPVSPYIGNSYASSTPNSGHSYENSIDMADTRSNTPTDFTESPFASDFVRRLSSSRNKDMAYPSVSPGLSRKLMEVKESDDEDSGPPPNYTAKYTTGRTPRESQHSASRRRTASSDAWYLDSPISALLVVLFFLFFGSIGVVYINKTSVGNSLASKDVDFRLCTNDLTHIPELNCVKEDDKTYVDLMISIILQELDDRLALSSCSTNSMKMSDNDMMNLIVHKDKSLSYWIVEKNLNNLKIIFEANPQWKIKPTKDGIELTEVPSSLYCTGLSYITTAADWIVKGSIAFLALLAVYVGVRWWIRKEARHKEEVFRLVANIIEIVSSKAAANDKCIPITHIRDQLIPLKDRQKTMRLWEDALKLLETDSRLRKEEIHSGGEEVLVWKWLASNLTTNKKKVWQGQAFDTLEGNLNSHVESPTNCLKIRHMFEPGQEEGDDWVTTVENAILEKCFNAKVLHLFVERQSAEGLVYMKCATPADAGIAYRALHGSWFASNLITVKYIREHRYHERFPDAINATKPRRPSNDYMRSLK